MHMHRVLGARLKPKPKPTYILHTYSILTMYEGTLHNKLAPAFASSWQKSKTKKRVSRSPRVAVFRDFAEMFRALGSRMGLFRFGKKWYSVLLLHSWMYIEYLDRFSSTAITVNCSPSVVTFA